MTPPINEGEDGTPINLAEFRQITVSAILFARSVTLPNQAPARGGEVRQGILTLLRAGDTHVLRVRPLEFSLKHKI